MKIVYMGTPDFAVNPLHALAEAGYEVTGVVTQPDKPKGRGKSMLPTPVKEEALKHGFPYKQFSFIPLPPHCHNLHDVIHLQPDVCTFFRQDDPAHDKMHGQGVLLLHISAHSYPYQELLPSHNLGG